MRVHRAAAAVTSAALLVCGGVAAALVVAGPAGAAPRSMVALGDSYAAGLGTRHYYARSGDCHRSPDAYAVIDAARVGARLSFRACAGATTSSVLHGQLGTLRASTTDVTVTVGGNDAGFRSVMTECAQPAWMSDCRGAVGAADALIRTVLPRRLDRLYAAIRRRAPGADVVVVGYPRLFMGEDCNAATWFSPDDEARLNSAANLLDATIRARATAHGFSFVDPRASFTGHAVCDAAEWINGLSAPLSESYHPNRRGQRAYAALVGRDLR